MKTWLKELERELKMRFYLSEVQDILSYYEEMIQERLDQGEYIDDILSDYDAKEIAKSMTTDVVMKRANDTYKSMAKSSKQLLEFLLSTPLLIPLGFAYVIVLIVLVSLIISLFATIFGSVIGMIVIFISMVSSGLGQNEIIGFLGVGLIGVSLATFILIAMSQVTLAISKKLIYMFSRLAKHRGDRK
ncbi:MAG: DUF1700 domain-containing protein [Acholeplasmataceae bacterium]|nr:DUF1700 domain-containing protein [Acholeplasmataceae bacterium]